MAAHSSTVCHDSPTVNESCESAFDLKSNQWKRNNFSIANRVLKRLEVESFESNSNRSYPIAITGETLQRTFNPDVT